MIRGPPEPARHVTSHTPAPAAVVLREPRAPLGQGLGLHLIVGHPPSVAGAALPPPADELA